MRFLALLAFIAISIASCHRQSSSQLTSTQDEATTAIRELGIENGADTGQKCGSCHTLTAATIRTWGETAQKTVAQCFSGLDGLTWQAPSSASALQAIDCLRSDPSDPTSSFDPSRLGLLAMGAKLDRFATLFKTAFGENTYRANFDAFSEQTGMPPQGSDWTVSETQFSKVLTWQQQGLPFLDTILPTVVAPATCEPSLTDSLAAHITEKSTHGWQARHLENGLMMFACSDNEPLNCFTQTKADGTSRFPLSQDTTFGQTWGKNSPNSQIRIIHDLGFSTSYWMRTSPDGRFVANGGARSGSQGNSTVTDLQDLLLEGGLARDIAINADYDPSFLPDNSAFLFQGDSTGICPLSVLRDLSISYIDFTQPGCTLGESNFGMSLYQSVGASLDGSDFVGVTGDFSSDGGSEGSYGGGFSSTGEAEFTVFVNNGTGYVNLFTSKVTTPFQGDYSMSPSNDLLITRFAGVDPNDSETLPLGYKLFKTSRQPNSTGGIDFKISHVGTACMKGKKGNMSLDERFWVTYGPVLASEFAEFGFASAADPEFLKLIGQSENIFLYDLVTSKNYRVTRMGESQYAQFSHFRADGWIVFMVHDRKSGAHYVTASDAAIRILRQR